MLLKKLLKKTFCFLFVVTLALVNTACRDDTRPGDTTSVLESETDLVTVDEASPANPVDDLVISGADSDQLKELEQSRNALEDIQATLYFGFDKTLLTSSVRSELTMLSAELKRFPSAISIEGHADERGLSAYNKKLGMRRAQSVASFLEQQGVSRIRMVLTSYGSEKPAVPGVDEASWAKNRRVEVSLIWEG